MTDIKRNFSDVMSYSPDTPGEYEESDQKKLHTKPGRKPIETEPKSKRTAQNRAAQRAYRERKERKMKELEDKVKSLEDENVKAMTETDFLRAQVNILKSELVKYRGSTDLSDLNLPKTVGHLSNPNPQSSNVSSSPQDNESLSGTSKGSVSDKASTNSSISNNSPNYSFGAPWSKDNLRLMKQQQQQQQQQFNHTHPSNDTNVPDLVSGSSSSTTPLNDNILVTPEGVTDTAGKNDMSLNFARNFEEEVDPFCVKLGEACGTKKDPVPKARKSIPNSYNQSRATTESTQFNSPFSNMSPTYPIFSNESKVGNNSEYNDNELFNLDTNNFDFNLVDNKYKDSDDPLSFLNDNDFDVSLAFGNPNNNNNEQRDVVDLLTTEESMYDPLNKDEVNTDFNFNDFIKNSITDISSRRSVSKETNGATPADTSIQPTKEKGRDIQEEDDSSSDEVVPAPRATMKCSEIWDRITAHPRYTEIDIDGLCNEMKNKAKCSEKGVVINSDDVSNLLERSVRK
ncbi:CAP1 [Candida theae]|uniref:CAP1 n=1 Tax=Candida theae TaxID=1198502 RepID=A0AAD5BAU5_9ASCO|nr:CAP1 [Candida theae]KAI5949461.1 CAP1 [Candida theae]